jgi:hypothetical protein
MAAHIFTYFAVLLFPIFFCNNNNKKKKKYKFETMLQGTQVICLDISVRQTPYRIPAPVLNRLMLLQSSQPRRESADSKMNRNKIGFRHPPPQQVANRGVTRYFMSRTQTHAESSN